MTNTTYDANEVCGWKVTRSGTVSSYSRLEGTLDEVLARVVSQHEDGSGYTTRLADTYGNTIIELYSNGSPQLGDAIRDDYVVLNTVTRNGNGTRRDCRYRIFKAL